MWSGDASAAAGSAVEGATNALQEHQQRLRDARDWCRNAATNIANVKETVTTNVEAGQHEIGTIEKTAAKTSQNPEGAIQAVVQRKYGENVATIKGLAAGRAGNPTYPHRRLMRLENLSRLIRVGKLPQAKVD